MAISTYYNRIKYTPTLGGLGDFVTGSSITGFRTPAGASALDGAIVAYVAFSSDQSEWETGQGTYTVATTTLARTTVRESSNANAKVNFTAAPTVAWDLQAQDLWVMGIASATSLALGGATIGANALAVTGTSLFNDTALLTKATVATLTLNFTTTSSYSALNFSQAGVVNTAVEYHGSTYATTNTRSALALVNQGGPIQFFPSNSSVLSGDFTTTRLQVGSAVGFSFSSTADASAASDTYFSRNAAGVVQFGTTTANAAGAWLAAKGTLTGGTLADQAQVHAITATQPASPSGTQRAITINITSAGSAGNNNKAIEANYGGGYTGNGFTAVLDFTNAAAGTGTSFIAAAGTSYPATANVGAFGGANATTAGTNFGIAAFADNGNINVGIYGGAQVAKNSAKNFGVVGTAINTGTTPVQIGGFFSLNQTTAPTVSAALIADNGAQTDAVALFRVAGVTNVSIGGTGLLVQANATDSTTTTSGALQVAGGMAVRKRIFADGLTASAGLQTAVICQSSAGELIADSVACLASSERFKTILGTAEAGAIDKISRVPIHRWKYKEEGIFQSENWTREHIGPTAEEIEDIDSRLVGYDNEGKARNISQEQLLALAIQAIQELNGKVDELKAMAA